MASMPIHKYRPFAPIDLPARTWPSRTIGHAPQWVSVDLRDGNQALAEPMGPQRKRRMFDLLVRVGFKEIEVGFPSASQTDFDFVRSLIETDAIPEDVTIQVITQAREELIDRTMAAVDGARRAVIHLYNSTSTLQRRVVFDLDRDGIVAIATRAVERIKMHADRMATEVVLEYSPESFTGTELDFAKTICEAVLDTWGASAAHKAIVNLPATVEMSTANVYGDMVEWMRLNLAGRERYILSVHPHNDRGTAVAAAECGQMAGAERVEGCLFGNGERTGNVCVVTLAMNLFTQGIDPELDLSDLPEIVRTVEYCNRMPVHARHPWVGELVFTAFSGSHQDAIKKGLAARERRGDVVWEVPYLPVDPYDIGRSYEAVVRVNSQSGKGGVAYLLSHDYGYDVPRGLQSELARMVQGLAEASGGEIGSERIVELFEAEFLNRAVPVDLEGYALASDAGVVSIEAMLASGAGERRAVRGAGNGPIDALVSAVAATRDRPIEVLDYTEHAIGSGAAAAAVAYVELAVGGTTAHGAGRDSNIVTASLRAVICALNRATAASEVGADDPANAPEPATAPGDAHELKGTPHAAIAV